jgi:hypothetical protein
VKIIFRSDPALIGLLPEPVPARAGLPDWLRSMAPRVASPLQGRGVRTVKQCPPFVDAMAHGFLIPLPCDVHVEGDGQFSWSWPLPPLSLHDHPRAPLSFHVAEQLAGSPLAHGQRSALKFNSYWTVELEAGWSLMAVHPVNRLDLPFRLLSGMVDADRFHDVGINFPALWTDPDFRGVLPRGTPIAQCYPVRREALELVCEPMSAEKAQRHQDLATRILSGPGVYRKHFRVKRGPA